MFDALVGLFESNNSSRQLALRNQLCDSRMKNEDTINSYFMRISQLKDQLAAIKDIVNEKELVTIALNGLPSSWEPFIQGICA